MRRRRPPDPNEPPDSLDDVEPGPGWTPPPPPPGPSKVGDALIAVLLVMSFGAPLVLGGGLAFGGLAGLAAPQLGVVLGGFAALAIAVGLSVLAYRRIREKGRRTAMKAAEVLVLVLLPLWGLFYSHFLGHETCEISSCSVDETAFRPFAEPEVFGLIALHAITAVAYAVSRRRPEALRPVSEAIVNGVLLAGAIVHTVIAVHVARWIGVGILIAPVFLPCVAPILTVIFYIREVALRLRRRGAEAATPPPHVVPDTPFRQGPVQEPLPASPRVHRGLLARSFAVAPALLGLHAVVHALWLGRADGALAVVTRTCGHVLSGMQIVVIPDNCHYLCTVAARGHTWLVRPERMGRRRGVPIVVNRQLAIANAFEDLLHERWPRFGRLARRIYDRLGLPISRYIRKPWLADLTYLVMKPAEWLFAVTLLLLDRGDPERRVDRMYR